MLAANNHAAMLRSNYEDMLHSRQRTEAAEQVFSIARGSGLQAASAGP